MGSQEPQNKVLAVTVVVVVAMEIAMEVEKVVWGYGRQSAGMTRRRSCCGNLSLCQIPPRRLCGNHSLDRNFEKIMLSVP